MPTADSIGSRRGTRSLPHTYFSSFGAKENDKLSGPRDCVSNFQHRCAPAADRPGTAVCSQLPGPGLWSQGDPADGQSSHSRQLSSSSLSPGRGARRFPALESREFRAECAVPWICPVKLRGYFRPLAKIPP